MLDPRARALGWPLRLALALAAAAVLLTFGATCLALAGVRWSLWSLALVVWLPGSLAAFWWVARRPGRLPPGRPASESLGASPLAARPRDRARLVAWAGAVVLLLSLAHLMAAAWAGRMTSPDLLYFWGVKGIRYAAAGGFDLELLTSPFTIHTHVNYPPLVPVLYAWATLWAGEMPWKWVPLSAALWWLAGAGVVHGLFRDRWGAVAGWSVTAFWGAALAASLVHSYSGGNAEAPLVFFLTLAVAALLAEAPGEGSWLRFAAGLGLAGAALTKLEGWAAVALLVAGTAARDRLLGGDQALRRTAPLLLAPVLALAPWWIFQLLHGIPFTDPVREPLGSLGFGHAGEILKAAVLHLGAGSWGLVWILGLFFLWQGRRQWRLVLPALSLAGGLLAFAFVVYLHADQEPARLVGWTLPRLLQPALSALVLAAGAAWFQARAEEPRSPRFDRGLW